MPAAVRKDEIFMGNDANKRERRQYRRSIGHWFGAADQLLAAWRLSTGGGADPCGACREESDSVPDTS